MSTIIVSVNPKTHDKIRKYDLAVELDCKEFNKDITTRSNLLYMEYEQWLKEMTLRTQALADKARRRPLTLVKGRIE